MDEPIQALIARGEREDSTMSRLWAAQQLGQVRGDDKGAAVGALSRMLEGDGFYGVRVESAQALGKLGGDAAAHALLLALKQANSRVRTATVQALGQLPQTSVIQAALLDTLRHDDSYAAQAAAARELGRMASSPALAALSESVASRLSPYVMAGLLEGLSNFQDPQATALLVEQSKMGATDEIRATAARLLKAGQSSRAQ